MTSLQLLSGKAAFSEIVWCAAVDAAAHALTRARGVLTCHAMAHYVITCCSLRTIAGAGSLLRPWVLLPSCPVANIPSPAHLQLDPMDIVWWLVCVHCTAAMYTQLEVTLAHAITEDNCCLQAVRLNSQCLPEHKTAKCIT
jgi:hypothetical protein